MNVITDDDDVAPSGSAGNAADNVVTSPDNGENNNGTSRQDRIVESVYHHLVQSVCIDVAANMHQLIKTGEIQQYLAPMMAPLVASRRELYPELYGTANGGEAIKSEEEIQELLDFYGVDHPADSDRQRRSLLRPGKKKRRTEGGEDDDEANVGMVTTANSKKKNTSAKGKGDADPTDDSMENSDPDDDDDDDDEDFKMDEQDENDDDDFEVGSGRNKEKKSGTPAAAAAGTTTTTTSDSATAADTPTDPATGKPPPTTSQTMDIWGKYPPKEPKDLTCECRLCGRQVSTSRFANHLDKCMGLSTRPLAGSANRV